MVERTRIIPKQKPPPDPKNNYERGVNFLQNFYSGIRDAGIETRDAYRKFAEAKKPVQIPGTNTYRMPLDYNQDTLRFIGNKLARGYEETADILQLPFEGIGQFVQSKLGFEPTIGSGVGLGDFFYTPSEADLLKVRDLQRPLEYDQAYTIQDDVAFQNYLRGQGFNVGDDFDFMRDIINTSDEDRMNEFFDMTQDRDSPYFVDINKFSAAEGMEPYNQALQDMFDQYNIDEANQFMSGMYDDFADAQLPFMVSDLAERLGVSEGSAESILMGGSATDFGLLNDFMDYYKGPFEYSTPEGQALFGDDLIMNLAGGVASIGKTNKLLKNMKNKLGTGRTAAVLEQLYPGTFGGGLNFPIRFGKDGARLNFGILQGYPTTSKLIRTPLQAYGTLTLPEFVGGE